MKESFLFCTMDTWWIATFSLLAFQYTVPTFMLLAYHSAYSIIIYMIVSILVLAVMPEGHYKTKVNRKWEEDEKESMKGYNTRKRKKETFLDSSIPYTQSRSDRGFSP